ncbi:MAG: deoxyribonuclease IV [Clostridiales bacterium]|nr:deoxyribonuclease IV [Clostridiales bacterium]
MMIIGPHISIAKSYTDAVKNAISIKANTFQFFTRNPRGGKAKELDLKDIETASKLMKENNFGPLLAHAPYTMNLASENVNVATFAKIAFADDLDRLEKLPCSLYNFHPGSHVGLGVDEGIKRIIDAINEVLTGKETTTILLETMSGKGSEIGRTFEELEQIIEGINFNEKIGVCLDTCHVYSAGYDIVNNLDEVVNEFDRIIGLDRLKAIHLNDSKTPFNSNKDRHEKIGDGTIGLETIVKIINHPKLSHLPFFLETPNENDGYKKEIEILKEKKNE